MKVLHVPYTFFPDHAGGTEVYVNALATWQNSLGCKAAVAAPATSESDYCHEGIDVWRFATSPDPDLYELYGAGDMTAARGFGRLLDQLTPDIVHLHAFTSGVSVLLAEQAFARGIPVLFNYHTPTVSCLRGTLLRWGAEICDGQLNTRSCASCTLHGHGLSRPLSSMISLLPSGLSQSLGRQGVSGGVWTALRMPELVNLRIKAFHRLMELVDRVFALCEWTRDLLVRNGVPQDKITLCRQGISWNEGDSCAATDSRKSGSRLRAAFLGRFDVTKGVDVAVRAIKSIPALPLQLDLFGIRQGEVGNEYAVKIRELIGSDPRVRMLPPLNPDEVISRLRDYDFLVVPSQWLETGPLVVLEAFAAGIPVVGSDLGGIAELVRDGIDGLLINSADSPAAWAAGFQLLCSNPDRLNLLRSGVRPPRHTRQVALEMIPQYENALAGRRIRPVTACGSADSLLNPI